VYCDHHAILSSVQLQPYHYSIPSHQTIHSLYNLNLNALFYTILPSLLTLLYFRFPMDPAYPLPEIWQSRRPQFSPSFGDFSMEDLEQKVLNHGRKNRTETKEDSVKCVSTSNGGGHGNSNGVVIACSIISC